MNQRLRIIQFDEPTADALAERLSQLPDFAVHPPGLSKDGLLCDEVPAPSTFILFWGPPDASKSEVLSVLASADKSVTIAGCSADDCVVDGRHHSHRWSAVAITSPYMSPRPAHGQLEPKGESGPIDQCLIEFESQLPKAYFTRGKRIETPQLGGHGVVYYRPAFLILFLPGMGAHEKLDWPAGNVDYQIVEALSARVSRNVAIFGGSAAATWPHGKGDGKWRRPWLGIRANDGTSQYVTKGIVGVLVETDLAFGLHSGHGLEPRPDHGHLVAKAIEESKVKDPPKLVASLPPQYHVAQLASPKGVGDEYTITRIDNPTLADATHPLLPDDSARWDTLVAYALDEALPNPPYQGDVTETLEFLRPVSSGSTLYHAVGKRKQVLDAAAQAVRGAISNGTIRFPESLFVINCRGRIRLLGANGPAEELKIIQAEAPAQCQIFGVYGDGETCTSARGTHLHRNWTVAVLALGSDFHDRYGSAARDQLLTGVDRMISQFSDVDSVLKRIVQVSLVLLQTDCCHIRILSNDGKTLDWKPGEGAVSQVAVPKIRLEGDEPGTSSPDESLMAYEAFHTRKPVIQSKADFMARHIDFSRWRDPVRAREVAESIECWLTVPILERGECLGVLSIASRDVRFMGSAGDHVKGLAQELATLAALPIRSTLMRQALQDALHAASQAKNPEELAKNIVNQGVRLLGRDANLAMMLPDDFEAPTELTCQACSGPDGASHQPNIRVLVGENVIPADKGICGYVFETGKEWSSDYAREEADGGIGPDGLRRPQHKSCIPNASANYVVPLRGRDAKGVERSLGVLNAEAPKGTLKKAIHLPVLRELAESCARSIEHWIHEKCMWGYLRALLPRHLVDALQEREERRDGERTSPLDQRPERKTVTILYVDIRGYTRMSEIVGEERLHEFIDQYYQLLAASIGQFHGTIDKYMGDGVFALFGDSEPKHDWDNQESTTQHVVRPLERAIDAGLAIAEQFQELAERWLSIWRRECPQVGRQHRFELGILVHTGTPLVGLFQTQGSGPQGRMTYTAIGRDVNLAARLGGEVDGNTVYISATAWQLLMLEPSRKFDIAPEPIVVHSPEGIPYDFDLFRVSAPRRKPNTGASRE